LRGGPAAAEPMKKDYNLWYQDVGRDWLSAHDKKGNLINKDYWDTTDKTNNAKYQRDLERKSMKETRRLEKRWRREEQRDALRFDREMRRS
jgi:hypothetical protein